MVVMVVMLVAGIAAAHSKKKNDKKFDCKQVWSSNAHKEIK